MAVSTARPLPSRCYLLRLYCSVRLIFYRCRRRSATRAFFRYASAPPPSPPLFPVVGVGIWGRPAFGAHRWANRIPVRDVALQRRSHCRLPPRRSRQGLMAGRPKRGREGGRERVKGGGGRGMADW